MADWGNSISAMADFYQTNIHTYQGSKQKPRPGRKAYWCPLIGANVFDDCSAFVSACLQLFGAFPTNYVCSSREFSRDTGKTAELLRNAGFRPIAYSQDILQPGDIYSGNNGTFHHVEICAGNKKTYSWGNIHDIEHGGMPSWMAKGPYQIIWRHGGKTDITTPDTVEFEYELDEETNIIEIVKYGYECANERNEQDANTFVKAFSTVCNNMMREIYLDDLYASAETRYNDKTPINEFVKKYYENDDKRFYNVEYANYMTNDASTIDESVALTMVFSETVNGKTSTVVVPHSDSTLPTTSSQSILNSDITNSDVASVPMGNAKHDQLARAVMVAKDLVLSGGFSPQQAAAIAGVFIDENGCNPHTYMKAEKAGKGAKGTGGFGYGAGIGSWTGEKFKNDLLVAGGFKPFTPIEKLSLADQTRLLLIDTAGRMKRYYNALKRTTNIEDAAATAVIITGGIGYSKNWKTHPTIAEAKRMSDIYGASNDKRFGKSEHHWHLYERRLGYARQVLSELQKQLA